MPYNQDGTAEAGVSVVTPLKVLNNFKVVQQIQAALHRKAARTKIKLYVAVNSINHRQLYKKPLIKQHKGGFLCSLAVARVPKFANVAITPRFSIHLL